MEQETLFHLIALGDKASDTLLQLRSDLGEWFDSGLLSNNKYHYLAALVDDNVSPTNLPKIAIDETGKLKVFVLDLGDKPRSDEWRDVLSYIWIPTDGQYDTVKKLFQIVYHNSLYIHSLISFDFNDWKRLASGANSLRIDTLHLNETVMHQLDSWPASSFPDAKYLIVMGSPNFDKTQMEEYIKGVNTLYDRLPSNSLGFWTIVGEELPKDEAYIALIQLELLAE